MNIVEESRRERGARTLTVVVYGLQLGTFVIPLVPAVIGAIINHVKLRDFRGLVYESHFRWQLRTFWWTLFWSVVGGVLIQMGPIGALILIAVFLWYLYRIVRGFIAWAEERPMYGTADPARRDAT